MLTLRERITEIVDRYVDADFPSVRKALIDEVETLAKPGVARRTQCRHWGKLLSYSIKTTGLNREAVSEIERLMREKGYSRSDLARLLGVSRVTVTQMLHPSSKLSLARLERVVRKMGYTVHLEIQPQLSSRYREYDDIESAEAK